MIALSVTVGATLVAVVLMMWKRGGVEQDLGAVSQHWVAEHRIGAAGRPRE